MMSKQLLEVKNLSVSYNVSIKKTGSFFAKKLPLHAVNNVSFNVKVGEILGIVGESGCGKSTLGKAILRLLDSNSYYSGQVLFEGKDILQLNDKELKQTRKMMQMIFQDPLASLNPKMLIKDIIAEPLKVFYPELSYNDIFKKVYNIMDKVGLAKTTADRYPHEFSGGQCQRIGIARAIILNPKLLVCDEAVSALDVSIKAQIINLLKDLQKEFNIAVLFISHDLSVVKYISDNIAVFYLGNLVEYTDSDTLYNNPKHPYTRALISSIPNTSKEDRIILQGDIPSPLELHTSCSFAPRCYSAQDICKKSVPQLTLDGKSNISCFFPHHKN